MRRITGRTALRRSSTWAYGVVNAFVFVAVGVVTAVYARAHPGAWDVLVGALVAALVFAGISYRTRLLSANGAVAGGMLAFSVVGLGGAAWAIPSLLFFLLSSLLSKVGGRKKRAVEAISEKGSRRDAGQVYANGGVGWALLLLYAVHPVEVLYGGFLGAFAAAAADTWATEVGAFSPGSPRLITTGRCVPRGTSGAVSLLGSGAAVLGALAVAVSAVPFIHPSSVAWSAAGSIAGAGLAGSLFDSLAGATLQARFRDPHTGGETERDRDGARVYPLVRGWRWLRNDQVNALCTLIGAVLAMAVFHLLPFATSG